LVFAAKGALPSLLCIITAIVTHLLFFVNHLSFRLPPHHLRWTLTFQSCFAVTTPIHLSRYDPTRHEWPTCDTRLPLTNIITCKTAAFTTCHSNLRPCQYRSDLSTDRRCTTRIAQLPTPAGMRPVAFPQNTQTTRARERSMSPSPRGYQVRGKRSQKM
jgi:hypothetical protein